MRGGEEVPQKPASPGPLDRGSTDVQGRFTETLVTLGSLAITLSQALLARGTQAQSQDSLWGPDPGI